MNIELTNKAIIDTVIKLQERGYDYDFVADQENIICLQWPEKINRADFGILEHHSYHLQENCNKVYHLFAIQLWNSGIKGILMNVHGFDEPIS